jgi:hypothetical protein
MKTKGDLIYWSMSEVNVSKDDLADLGFGDFVPRNDFQTSLLKAFRSVCTRGEIKYERFNENDTHGEIVLFTKDQGAKDLNKILALRYNKKTGETEWVHTHPTLPTEALKDRISHEYTQAKKTLDSVQLGKLVVDFIYSQCHAISMRPGGGIYFIDARFTEAKAKLEKLFAVFSGNAWMQSVPVYDDQGTASAIERAAGDAFLDDVNKMIDSIQAEFADGTITKRKLNTKKEQAEALLKEVGVHRDNLRSKARDLESKLGAVSKALFSVTAKVEAGIIEPQDFMDMLKGL